MKAQLETAKSELGKPFPQEKELSEKLARLAELDTLLNIDSNAPEVNEQEAESSQHDSSISEKLPPMSFDECISVLTEAVCEDGSEVLCIISRSPESNSIKARISDIIDKTALELQLFSRCTDMDFTPAYFGEKHNSVLDGIISTAKDKLGIAAEKRPSVLGQIAELKAAQATTISDKPPQKNQSLSIDE